MKFKSMVWALFISICLFNATRSNSAFGYDFPASKKQSSTTAFDLKFNASRPRNFLFPPLASLVLPGFDQWLEGQYGYAAIYSGVALSGIGLGLSSKSPSWAFLGYQLYLGSGNMSAYHSFRSAVKSRQVSMGDFAFLKHDESPTDLLLAPLHFSYLARPTTYIGVPAFLLVSLLLVKLQKPGPLALSWKARNAANISFLGAVSYNAGVGEEAFFRGWMMPVTMQYMNSEIASNAITSLAFGAIHYKKNYIPISQTLGGFYLV